MEPGDLDGVFLVIACTDNREVNAAVTREAQERGLLVLCADDPERGQLRFAGAVRRGDLVLTVSTGGGSPTLAAVLRERLEAEFGPEWAELTADARRDARNCQNEPRRSRRAKLPSGACWTTRKSMRLLRDGKRLEAETRIRQCLSSSSE